MKPSRVLEQNIAVFGASGSGKTVMLSSFYGATQEPQYRQNNLFHVVADTASTDPAPGPVPGTVTTVPAA